MVLFGIVAIRVLSFVGVAVCCLLWCVDGYVCHALWLLLVIVLCRCVLSVDVDCNLRLNVGSCRLLWGVLLFFVCLLLIAFCSLCVVRCCLLVLGCCCLLVVRCSRCVLFFVVVVRAWLLVVDCYVFLLLFVIGCACVLCIDAGCCISVVASVCCCVLLCVVNLQHRHVCLLFDGCCLCLYLSLAGSKSCGVVVV